MCSKQVLARGMWLLQLLELQLLLQWAALHAACASHELHIEFKFTAPQASTCHMKVT